MPNRTLGPQFFDRDAQEVARDLLGKVLAHRVEGMWLEAYIIEAEAYYRAEKGSHASLGYTEKRKALFMPPGTVYMYFARGGPSFNVSCRGAGDAVLCKAGYPRCDAPHASEMLRCMARLNPLPGGRARARERLCSGQTLLCRALGLGVAEWDQHGFAAGRLELRDVGYRPERIVCTPRLGIPPGRDEHLPYRFVDCARARFCTQNPLTRSGQDYREVSPPAERPAERRR